MDREPIPPAPSRGDHLGQLRTERWHAMQAKEWARVAELEREIARLSAANTASAPTRETTAAQQPVRTTAARTTKPKPTKRGAGRVAAR